MTLRWLACVVVGLAAQAGYGQTAPVAAPDYEDTELADAPPMAPTAPPALPHESPSPRPFAGAVWTSGHWFWDGAEWRFKPGAWIAPMPGYQFVNGYWQQDGGGWRWISSGWAQPGSTEVEFPLDVVSEELSTTQAPPPLRTESQSQPVAGATWAPGYWYWSGNEWAWVEGAWVTPPRPGLVFVSPRWVRHRGSWTFVSGGWATPGSARIVIPVYRHARVAVRWGHPGYFLYSWHRYPMVHRYYGGRHDGRRHDDGPRWRDRGPRNHHPATPAREHRRGDKRRHH
ncbi:MAG TPA: hypothetical protein VNA24_28715 [Hyalangium sp.]|nr:hypothetical protein [Hyalangium sp.]